MIENDKISMKETLRHWSQEIRSRPWPYIIGILAVAGTNVVDVFIPKIIQWNIDTLANTQSFNLDLIWLLVGTYFFQFGCRVLWRRKLALQSFKAAKELKSRIWDKARHFPLSLFHKRLTRGELINLATSDVTSAQNVFGFHFVASTDFIFLFSLAIIFMLSISIKLTLISLVLFPLIPIFIFFLCEKEAKLYESAQNSLTQLNDTVDSIVGAAKLMKLQPDAPLWNQKLESVSKNYQLKRKSLLSIDAQFFPATALPPAISVVFFLFFGLTEFKNGNISLGQLVAFHTYLYMIADPLSELGWLVSDWQKALTSLQRLLGVFKEKQDPIFHTSSLTKTGSAPLLIQNLKFSHDSQNPLLFISHLKLEKGERLGIKGEVASGKSTLGKIISGIESGYQGQVLVFGTDVKELKNSEIRSKISLVDQNPFLFGNTIRQNLCLDRDISDHELWKWLEVVDLVEDFKSLPNALDSHLGEWGINLSGGQRQRLTLARALCRKPEILILDDALSAIDVVTEEKIIKRLEVELKELSVLLISHRDSSLSLCHKRIDLSQSHRETSAHV